MSTEQHYSVMPASLPAPQSHGIARPEKKRPMPYRASLGMALLRRASRGQLLLIDPNGVEHRFGDASAIQTNQATTLSNKAAATPAVWILHDWSVFDRALSRGDVGFGECWMEGLWDSPDPTAVLRFMLQNRQALDQGIYGTWLGQWLDRLRHMLRRNSRSGSRRNIQAHYDLGNDFYQLWLDPSMTYSSALLDQGTYDLEQGQLRKYDRILDELALSPGASVLEIGCGWGGFALRARQRDLQMKCLTLSSEQLSYAQTLHQLESSRHPTNFGSAQFCLQDYRDEQARYDGVVSIEMFEAVGEAYWDSYFQKLRHCLKPGGKAVIQSITIDEQYFERYRSSTDFIQQYIFPGGMLPSPERLIALASSHGLTLYNRLSFGADYAWTLARWHERFVEVNKQLRELGYDERFIRMWRFYLAYCEAGFAEAATDVMQFSFVRH